MSSSSDANTVALLNNITILLNRYLGIVIFTFGTLGNILNIFVLRQKALRSNPCSWLFFTSSVVSLILFFVGLSTRILSGWNLDFTRTNQVLCKLRSVIAFASPTMFYWLIALSTIDRWFVSSILAGRRQKSTLKNAQRGTLIVICLSIALYIQLIICQEAELPNTPLKCYSKSTECRIITDISFAIISILCPLLVMIIFGILTIFNVRDSYRRTNPINSNANGNENQSSNTGDRQRQRKRIDRQLSIMLFFQVTVLTILSIPFPIQRLYSTITLSDSQTVLQGTINSFCYSLVLLLLYIALGSPFYIYTLSGGKTFRKGLFNILRMLRRTLLF